MADKYKRMLIPFEIKKGYLYIPIDLKPELVLSGDNVKGRFMGEEFNFKYDEVYNRLDDLRTLFDLYKIEAGELLLLSVEKKFLEIEEYYDDSEDRDIEYDDVEECESEDIEEEVEVTIDLTRLPQRIKGNIAEDRIKEYILVFGQGLLNIYRPILDNHGIDLIVNQTGIYHSLFLQVKSRYIDENITETAFGIPVRTFRPHRCFFIIGITFYYQSLEAQNKILFLPSTKVLDYDDTDDECHWIPVFYDNDSTDSINKYFVKMSQLADKIIEEISSMNKDWE